jgi:hypothetical protein
MARKTKETISAQVVLRPASGRRSGEPITSENIGEALPSIEAADRARKAFTAAGFEVGPLVANSFPITAPVSTFDKVFKTRMQRERPGGAMKAVRADGSAKEELPLAALPHDVGSVIEAVTVTPPPDFGPSSY